MPSKPILVVDDHPDVRTKLFEAVTRLGHAVALAENGEDGLEKFKSNPFDLVVTNLAMPGLDGMELLKKIKSDSPETPVIMIADSGTVDDAVEAMRLGALDFILKPLDMNLIGETINRALTMSSGNDHRAGSTSPLKNDNGERRIITQDPGMKRLLEMAGNIAPSKATVLIQGESGTGKELLARLIHRRSDRAYGQFVAINCASLPEGLLESELFGHEKGSFTGASSRKIGKFELADMGTILLDEISEMAMALQAKLLRVLQEGEIDRVGGKSPIPINVRVIATTNRDLAAWVREGNFRQDLYYRINVIPLKIPALSQRSGDIPELIKYFLEKYSLENNRAKKSMSQETLNNLCRLDWPGNVRELENIIARGVLLARGDKIKTKDLMLEEMVYDPNNKPMEMEGGWDKLMTIREMERQLIQKALTETDGNRTHAAKILGISVRTLRNKLSEYKNMDWETGQAA